MTRQRDLAAAAAAELRRKHHASHARRRGERIGLGERGLPPERVPAPVGAPAPVVSLSFTVSRKSRRGSAYEVELAPDYRRQPNAETAGAASVGTMRLMVADQIAAADFAEGTRYRLLFERESC
jgi:hypothetical protein